MQHITATLYAQAGVIAVLTAPYFLSLLVFAGQAPLKDMARAHTPFLIPAALAIIVAVI